MRGFRELFLISLMLVISSSCASPPRSELTVQVEQREERPSYSIAMKVMLP